MTTKPTIVRSGAVLTLVVAAVGLFAETTGRLGGEILPFGVLTGSTMCATLTLSELETSPRTVAAVAAILGGGVAIAAGSFGAPLAVEVGGGVLYFLGVVPYLVAVE